MKSIKIEKAINTGSNTALLKKTEAVQKFSKLNILNHLINVTEVVKGTTDTINTLLSYLAEREKTKKTACECLARVVESENSLRETIEKELTKQYEIHRKSLIDIEKITNKQEQLKVLRSCLHQIITTTNELKVIYNETNDRAVLDMIHDQNMRLIGLAESINAIQ